MAKKAKTLAPFYPRYDFAAIQHWTEEQLDAELTLVTKDFTRQQSDLLELIAVENYTFCGAAKRAGVAASTVSSAMRNGMFMVAVAVRREQLRREAVIERSWVLMQFRELYDRAKEAGDLQQQRASLNDMARLCGYEPSAKLDINAQATINHIGVMVPPQDVRALAALHQLIEENPDVFENHGGEGAGAVGAAGKNALDSRLRAAS